MDDSDSGSSGASRTILILVTREPHAALRVEDTTPGWEDLVPDAEYEPLEA